MIRYAKMSDRWIDDLRSWTNLDLAVAHGHWESFFKVPPFLWHEGVFKSLGLELGVLVEISSRPLER